MSSKERMKQMFNARLTEMSNVLEVEWDVISALTIIMERCKDTASSSNFNIGIMQSLMKRLDDFLYPLIIFHDSLEKLGLVGGANHDELYKTFQFDNFRPKSNSDVDTFNSIVDSTKMMAIRSSSENDPETNIKSIQRIPSLPIATDSMLATNKIGLVGGANNEKDCKTFQFDDFRSKSNSDVDTFDSIVDSTKMMTNHSSSENNQDINIKNIQRIPSLPITTSPTDSMLTTNKIVSNTSNIDLPVPTPIQPLQQFCCTLSHIVNPKWIYIIPDYNFISHHWISHQMLECYKHAQPLFTSKNEIVASNLKYFAIKCYPDEDVWCRAEITDLLVDSHSLIEFQCIDYGHKTITYFEHAQKLNRELYNYPPLAYRCSLHCVEPLAQDQSEWSIEAIKYMEKFILTKFSAVIPEVLNGIPQLNLFNEDGDFKSNMAVNNLIKLNINMENGKDFNNESKFYDNTHLIQSTEPKSEKLLKSFIDKEENYNVKIKLSGSTYEDESLICPLPLNKFGKCFKDVCKKQHVRRAFDQWTALRTPILGVPEPELPTEGSVLKVIVTNISSFQKFFVQIICADNSYTKVKNIENKNLDLINSRIQHVNISNSEFLPAIGQFVAAKPNNCLMWQRAIVVDLLENKAMVFFIDYGNSCLCDVSELCRLNESCFEIPKQALQCALANVRCTQGKFRKLNEMFSSLTLNKTMNAEVSFVEIGDCTLDIVLFNENGQNISDILQKEGLVEIVKTQGRICDSKYFPC